MYCDGKLYPGVAVATHNSGGEPCLGMYGIFRRALFPMARLLILMAGLLLDLLLGRVLCLAGVRSTDRWYSKVRVDVHQRRKDQNKTRRISRCAVLYHPNAQGSIIAIDTGHESGLKDRSKTIQARSFRFV